MSFIFGKETNLLPIVENSLHGKETGSEISIEVSPELGFGKIDKNLIFIDELENVPSEYIEKSALKSILLTKKELKRNSELVKSTAIKLPSMATIFSQGRVLFIKLKLQM